MIRRRQRANLTTLLLGLLATAAVVATYTTGGLEWLELKTLDLRFCYANSIAEDPRIVCVDIDDSALRTIGRWPWPRDIQAGVIAILAEAGAKALLYDITLSEREPIRNVWPRHADLEADPLRLVGQIETIAFPDHELRLAIAAAGNVYLAFDYRTAVDSLQTPEFRRVLTAVRQEDLPKARALINAYWPAAQPVRGLRRPEIWARLIVAMEADPLASSAALAARLGLDHLDAADRVEDCRTLALRRWVRAWLKADPARWRQPGHMLFDALAQELFGEAPGGSTRHWEAAALALLDVLGYEATMRGHLAPLAQVAPAAAHATDLSPIYWLHARAARRCGFVVFEPDRDGVARRMPLLVQHDGRVLPQLALAAAFDELDLTPADVSAAGRQLVLRRPEGEQPLVIQLDERGRALVPWLPQRDWERQFAPHVPVGAVWQVFDRRLSMRHNQELVRDALHGLLEAGYLPEYQQYHDDLKRRLELDSELRLARYREDTQTITDVENWIAQYDRVLAEAEPGLRAGLTAEVSRLETSAAPEPEGQLWSLRELERAFAANDEYRAEIQQTLARLRSRLEGKICLIGYTATSVADMTPIPTHERAPGIMAHANLLNGLLTGQMVRWASVPFNAALAAACGLLVTALSLVRPVRETGQWLAVLLLVFVALAGWWAFYQHRYWIAVTPALGAMLLSYLAITFYRYVFVDRQRRQLTTALSQYTSSTLARKMADDPALCRRAETREVTVMFTDLRGFTPISERIGAERTQHVLNIWLGRSSEIMLRHEALINKFIGDGVFAFWNPPIHPQPDHAERACRTAIELIAALRRLGQEPDVAADPRVGRRVVAADVPSAVRAAAPDPQSGRPVAATGRMPVSLGDEVFAELRMGVGIATGQAVVGPCGSEQKYDYTCIGDTVNVAARLEPANKFYGTSILVSQATRERVGQQFAFRPLGGVQVKGRRQPVPIYELLGRAGEVPEDLLDYAQHFGQAVALFQQRQWLAAREAFELCRRRRPDDVAARRYLQAAIELAAHPPPEDWNAALELTER